MAIVYDNIFTTGLNGKVGRQIVFRYRNGVTYVSKYPTFTKAKTEAQKKQISRFREAVLHAKTMLNDSEIYAIYAEKAAQASKPVTAYNMAIADYLHAPEIHNIDLDTYHGKVCDAIIISATDDFQVNGVMIEIFRDDGSLLELGVAQAIANGPEWVYYAQSVNDSPKGCKVIASVSDFAGNVTVKELII